VEMRLLFDDATRRATDLRASFDRLLNAEPAFADVIEQSQQLAKECCPPGPV